MNPHIPPPAIPEFLIDLDNSLADDSFVKLSLGDYKGGDAGLKNIYVRKILVKRDIKLSFTYHFKTRDIVKNYSIEESLVRIEDELYEGFGKAILYTTVHDISLDIKSLKKSAPTHSEPPSVEHDRNKKRLITAENKPYLHALNITDAQGNVFKNAQDKFRQINKYVEILGGLIKHIPAENIKNIVDMGAGKGYLTFALYDYLSGLGLTPNVIGVEYRPDLVDLCNRIAERSQFTGLHFVEGTVANYDSTNANILIALHACDTATDDAIYKGITADADLIVVAPCCHKQIRRELDENKVSNDIDFLLKHGIFIERQAEMVTDGLRALILEYFGYTTKVFEFISDAHTPKNVMIVGTRSRKLITRDPAILKKIAQAKSYFGITQHHLEKMLGL
ncbi:MAG: SAM-dependent methyltransferase [Pseudomonadota bacterium]